MVWFKKKLRPKFLARPDKLAWPPGQATEASDPSAPVGSSAAAGRGAALPRLALSSPAARSPLPGCSLSAPLLLPLRSPARSGSAPLLALRSLSAPLLALRSPARSPRNSGATRACRDLRRCCAATLGGDGAAAMLCSGATGSTSSSRAVDQDLALYKDGVAEYGGGFRENAN